MSAYFASLLVLATAGHATATLYSATCGSGTTPATFHIFADGTDCKETIPGQGGNASAADCAAGLDWSTKITCNGSTAYLQIFDGSRNCSGPLRAPVKLPAGECVDASSSDTFFCDPAHALSLIHISEPTRQEAISYAVFCLKKKK